MTMTIQDKMTKLQDVWAIVLPHVPTPSAQDVGRWLQFEYPAVERAIMRTANRFATERVHAGFEPVDAYRYTTATARRMQEETKRERRAAA